MILGTEFSGTILSTNPPALSTSTFAPGARVYGAHLGSFATHIAVPLANLRVITKQWRFKDAAGISSTLPVSYGALKRAGVKKGEVVLVHAAAGGLGLMAVQLAKSMGCTVIGTASSPSKRQRALDFGADHVIDYTLDNWPQEVLRLTGGKGVDVVYDPVGLVDKSVKCLAHFGRILLIGFAGREGDMEKVAMNRLLLKQATVIGYRAGETTRRRPEETAKTWDELEGMIERDEVRPTVFGTEYRGLESLGRAMDDLAGRKVWGKAVIEVAGEGGVKAKI